MTAKYFAILTNYGAAQLANAVALGTQMNITAMAVGDGGGTLPVPDPAQTTLIRENRRAAVNQVSVDEKNPNIIIAEQVIPENEGGWWIREIGLYDDNGGLIAIGNVPETYKPNLQEGSGRTQVLQMALIVSSTQAVTLKVDPSVVLATREYVTKSIDAAIQASEARAAKTYQPIGDYVTHPYLKLELLKKIDKADIANQLGNDPKKVASQQLLTTEIGKKAALADVSKKLDLTGGTLTGQLTVKEDGAGIIVQPKKENGASYIQGRDHEGKATWFIGLPTDGGTAVYFRNYLTDTEISLHSAGATIKGKLGLSDYSNFDDRYGQPVGSVVFLLHGDTPAGRYIKANGAAISRTTYADLYAVLGVKYGSGNGSTTFNVPDLRGEFPRFWDDGRGVDSGRVLGTAQGDAMRNLTGTLSRLYGEGGGGTGVFRGVSVANSSKYSSGSWEGDRATEFNASNQVPTAGEFRPRNIALAAWIKY
ncbi:TPA: phage tail protein [Morganella morganii]